MTDSTGDVARVNNMERLRLHLGLTVREFAEALGSRPSTVRNWRKGKVEPSLTSIRSAQEVYGEAMAEIGIAPVAAPMIQRIEHFEQCLRCEDTIVWYEYSEPGKELDDTERRFLRCARCTAEILHLRAVTRQFRFRDDLLRYAGVGG